MKILLAEAKTMNDSERDVSPEVLREHTPIGEKKADEIMAHVAGMTVPEIAERVRLSLPLATRLFQMAYEFPNKSMGYPAIEAFTGVVFKAFDYPSLSDSAKKRTGNDVRIISSLYGFLRPDDVIKPYRFDFTTKILPPSLKNDFNSNDISLAAFWKPDVTEAMIKELDETQDKLILNLLPGDAEKSIDMKRVGKVAEIWKVDFKELKEEGTLKTPHAGQLKTLRGELLRLIIKSGITHPEELFQIDDDRFMPSPDHSTPGLITIFSRGAE